jgi:hypothetical protein
MEIPNGIEPKFVETSSVKQVMLYTNTPSFLLSRLRKDSATSYVANTLSAKDTIEALSRLKQPKNVDELLWVYVLLASFALRDQEQLETVRRELETIDLSMVEWGNDLRQAILSEATPTAFNTIRYGSGIEQSPGISTSSATGYIER